MKNRREEIRKVKRYLSQTLNKMFEGQKPTEKQAEAAFHNLLKYYKLPPAVGVRLNRVHAGVDPVRFDIDIFNPLAEERKEMFRRLTDMSPEEQSARALRAPPARPAPLSLIEKPKDRT